MPKVFKSFKVELDPNNEQRTLFAKNAGCARFAYNWMLGILKEDWDSGTKKYKVNFFAFCKLLNSKKKTEFPWMYEVSKCCPNYAMQNVEQAYKRYFKKISDFPRFKKRGATDSFSLSGVIKVTKTHIKLPRIGWIRLKENNYIPEGKPKKVTVSLRAGKWFIGTHYEIDIPQNQYNQEILGVDLGIKSLATLSDGTQFKNTTKQKQLDRSLKRQQRKISRQQKGSNSRNKTKLKLQKLYYRISCARQDNLHKFTSFLVKTKPEGTLVIEDLNVAGMLKNHKLARAISNCGFGEFKRQIEYKAEWYGKKVIFANTFFPSSKMCSNCSCLKQDLKLSDRIYKCDCGLKIDRDLNAAINLKNYKEPPKAPVKTNTVGSTGINAGGDGRFILDPKKSKRCPSVKPESNSEELAIGKESRQF